ncbi:DUF6325 family protein [Agromyces ramosus]|uniref:DUF1269 domain-containing protein n=1 Tax=Agromyces ramosus TaxID=33879 RepID=A0ABU0R779_9MICO|nr:DUF6325 family protein [Agromyces ramosus]MDQ0893036.1 hypothetical protein [Agromyces ramosus]
MHSRYAAVAVLVGGRAPVGSRSRPGIRTVGRATRRRMVALNPGRRVRTERGMQMSDAALDELGPVDFVIVEFPAGESNFTGEMAEELLKLVDAGTIRVIDVLILTKDENGDIDAVELEDLDDLGELARIEADLAELLAEEDVVNLAAAMEPGSVAGVLVYENLWAAPFAAAARRAGGQLIANGRIPIQAIIASLEADGELETVGE